MGIELIRLGREDFSTQAFGLGEITPGEGSERPSFGLLDLDPCLLYPAVIK